MNYRASCIERKTGLVLGVRIEGYTLRRKVGFPQSADVVDPMSYTPRDEAGFPSEHNNALANKRTETYRSPS